MRQFKDIMNEKDYYISYQKIVKAIKNDTLICYLGAGMSLYSKSWGEPFLNIARDLLNCWEKREYKSLLGGSSEVIDNLKNIVKRIELVDKGTPNRGDTYPKLGDKLQKIINENSEALTRINRPPSFNSYFASEIKKLTEKHSHNTGDSKYPYSYPAAAFFPYLNCLKYITTNCDSTFFNVFYNAQKMLTQKVRDLKTWYNYDEPIPVIFYIHGMVEDPNSLIMTQKDYNRQYINDIQNYEMLNDAVGHGTILFLGASLYCDKTVDIFNRAAKIKQTSKFIVILRDGTDLQKCTLVPRDNILTLDFESIPVILHQLIRDTSPKNKYCCWNRECKDNIPYCDLNYKDIDNFLMLKNDYEELTLFGDESIKDSVLAYITQNHLFTFKDIHECPNWQICEILDERFTLEGTDDIEELKSFSILHNCPLDNTIYLIDGNKINYQAIQNFTNRLSTWYKDEYTSYPFNKKNAKDEQFCKYSFTKNNVRRKLKSRPKIRVIIILPNKDKINSLKLQEMLTQVKKILLELSNLHLNKISPEHEEILKNLQQIIDILFEMSSIVSDKKKTQKMLVMVSDFSSLNSGNNGGDHK